MKTVNLLSSTKVKVIEPREASADELALFHHEKYIDQIREASKSGEGFLDLGDTPAFKGCYEASALAAGASLKAVELVMSGQVTHAINISGGLHHAHPDRASGFCIFNDPAISIRYLMEKYSQKKVLYLDVDAHHGDGVMYGFYSDPSVLDIDFHEDGRHLFPGTGFTEEIGEGSASGLKINVPLPPLTGDESFLELFHEIVPAAVRSFKPQVLLLQCGADSHTNDLLAHLQLTTKTYCEVAKVVHELAHEVADGHLVVFGGGGYNIANVARAWTLVASTLSEYEPPRETPKDWRKLFEALVGEKAPEHVSSEGEAKLGLSGNAERKQAADILADLKRRVPYLT
jgi:acetoin utilization protein AcuC